MLKFHIDKLEVGIDEAGRGPLLGRVYAGAVIWGETIDNIMIQDSKKLTKNKRKDALKWIKENVYAWGVGWAEVNEIDTMNILEATKLAMERAIDNLKKNFNLEIIEYLIIDGIKWENKFKNYKTTSIIKGDNKYYSIAAASILAKEYHDDYIRELCLLNKDLDNKYNLSKNMGYGTQKHIEGLIKYGLSEYHRQSFTPKILR
jgi:ribonuclease HII